MAIDYQNKELQTVLNGINKHLKSKNSSLKTKRMELLAAEAILRKQLKTIQSLQQQQLKRNIFLCFFSIAVFISVFFVGMYFYG